MIARNAADWPFICPAPQSRGGEKIVKASRIVEGSALPVADRRTISGPGVSAVVASGP